MKKLTAILLCVLMLMGRQQPLQMPKVGSALNAENKATETSARIAVQRSRKRK